VPNVDLRAAHAPSPLAARLSGAEPANAAERLGGAFLSGAAEGPPGLPTEVMRAITQALESSLASAASGFGASAQGAQDAARDSVEMQRSTHDALSSAWPAGSAMAQLAADDAPKQSASVQNQVLVDRDARLALQMPQPAARADHATLVPVLVSTLHAAPAASQRLAVQRQWREQQQRSAQHCFEPEDSEESSPETALETRADQASPEPATVRRFRRLWRHLQTAPQHSALAASADLAQRRRVMLIAPSARPGAAPAELEAHLLGSDAQGIGRAASYRARGALAAAAADAGAAWPQWRAHRDATLNALPRLVVTRSMVLRPAPSPGALSIRLSPTAQAPPLRDAQTSWLDILDVRRFLHDLGTQWSLLILWSPHPLAATGRDEAPMP
jgi:hypothetical protein